MKAIRLLSVALLVGMLAMLTACSGSDGVDGSGDIAANPPAPAVDGTVDGSGTTTTDTTTDTTNDCTPADVQIIKPSPLSIAHPIVGQLYQRAFRGQGGSCDGLVWSVDGALPAGLDLVPDATSKYKVWIKGTPTAAGDFPITLVAKDADDDTKTDSFAFTLTVDVAGAQPAGGSTPGGSTGGSKPGVSFAGRIPISALRIPVSLLANQLSSGELSINPVSNHAIDVAKGPIQTVPMTLTAVGGRAPYTWSADKDGNSGHWIISNIADISTCGADGSNTCAVTVAGFSPVLSDVTKDPVTDISFTVTDADGKTATQTAKFTATYPDAAGAAYDLLFAPLTSSPNGRFCLHYGDAAPVLLSKNHVEFFFYWKLDGSLDDANIIATSELDGGAYSEEHLLDESTSLPVSVANGYENHLSDITAITVRVTPSDSATSCDGPNFVPLGKSKLEDVPKGTIFENDYWTWELPSTVKVNCDDSDSDKRDALEKQQGYHGTIVANGTAPLLTRKTPWWFVNGS